MARRFMLIDIVPNGNSNLAIKNDFMSATYIGSYIHIIKMQN